MAKLVLRYDGLSIREFDLAVGEMTIGRRSDNDIQLDDPAVSGCHAILVVAANEFFPGSYDVTLRDTGSTNGTFVNGTRVTEHRVKQGDMVRLGRHELVYEEGPGSGLEQTSIFLADD